MKTIHRTLCLLSFLPLAACAATGPEPPVHTISFEADAIGAVPQGFGIAETNGIGHTASWRVENGVDPDDPGHVVGVDTANSGSTYNLLLSAADFPADCALSVYLLPCSGDEDQGGGLLWRARDADNYYVARWNPLEDNVRLYTVIGGERTMLASADVEAAPRVWHRLAVTMRGDAITVAFDGKTLIQHRDTTFSAAGRVGLWTKADAATRFDRIEWSELP
ncbi:MAG: hypothetical protein KDC98_26755 [Planctomycetes bacterium]|nr:hypothetical protein [Planctomycetota bacterium]